GVADGAREHELVGERAPVLAEVGAERRARPRRLEPDDAAHRGRETDGSTHVVAVRDGYETRGDRGRGAAARAARAAGVVPRVARRTIRERFRGETGRELRGIRLADEHEPGGAKARGEP